MKPIATAHQVRQTALDWLSQGLPAIVVRVVAIKGSTPRGVGTRMIVGPDQITGTIGGGHLEWRAVSLARQTLAEWRQGGSGLVHAAWQQVFALGPTLGQCCGGSVTLSFEPLSAELMHGWPLPQGRFHLELHGAGHVGQALIHVLCGLDCTVRWIDERDPADESVGLPDAAMLEALPPHIEWHLSDQAEAEVPDAPAGCCHLVMTHRHDLDLRIVRAILQRGDAHFVGLIGSQTKRAQFRRRLAEQGIPPERIESMVCPIGLDGVTGKEPMVIAVSVAAQLLQQVAHRAP
ncbi:MAG: xanthine dehydrogenase accessory protein XdhC [Burkholderiales bacterium]|nr:xanthine dehydrogenase accessory protein XdhC [Burkholderiales bacterium]